MIDHARRPAEAGLTLFETLIATGVLGMVFLGLLAAMSDSFLAERAAYASSRSQSIGERVMEEVIENQFDDLLGLDGSTLTESGFTAAINVVEVDPDLRLIEVTVSKPGTYMANTRLLTYRARR